MTQDQKTAVELKGCPFCGGEGEHYQPNEDIAVISCTKCNAESGYYGGEDSTTPEEAIAFWNKRHTPESAWRCISTAPVDTKIIVFDTDECFVARKIDNGVTAPLWCTDRGVRNYLMPTHWMPLPSLPSDSDKGE